MIRPVFFLILTISAINLKGQKLLSEGSIIYDVRVHSDTKEPGLADAFDGATATLFVKGSQSRTELFSAIGSAVTLYDARTGVGVVLREYGPQKLLIRLNRQHWASKNKKYEGIVYTPVPANARQIAGYTCVPVEARLKDGSTFSILYTTEIVMENKDYDAQFRNLPGLPLEFESTVGGIRVTYTARRVSFDPVPVQKFEIPRVGYREMTYEESLRGGQQ